jgi:hypothetical protein
VLEALDKGKITMEAAQAFTIEPDRNKQAVSQEEHQQHWMLGPTQHQAAFTAEAGAGRRRRSPS